MPVIIWLNGGFGAGKTTLAAELVVATALSLRRHHADTLIVPMSLIRDAYRAEILGGLAEAAEEVLHVFLEAEGDVLRERLKARAPVPDALSGSGLGLDQVDSAVAAAARQPSGTLMLRSDRLTPAELADKVLAAASLRFLRQRPPSPGHRSFLAEEPRGRPSASSVAMRTMTAVPCAMVRKPVWWLLFVSTNPGATAFTSLRCSLAGVLREAFRVFRTVAMQLLPRQLRFSCG